MRRSITTGEAGSVRNARLVYATGPLAFTGVQLVAPTLPLIQAELGLSSAELALVTSIYLLPAALFALPAGFLADRLGRRRVMGWSLVVFGLCGAAYPFVSAAFPAFLGVRFVQGVAFAAILPLTITILGDSYRGADLVRAQGFRTVSLGTAEAALPVIGGVLASIRWEAAWLIQALALPFGVVVLLLMTDLPSSGGRRMVALGRDLTTLLRSPSIAALQWVGIQRMFVKFSLLAFLPVYFVSVRGFSTEFTGLVIGLSAAIGVAVALFAVRITRRGSMSLWVGGSLLVVALTIVGYILAPVPWMILGFAVIHGAADGLTGVLSNSLVAVATTGELRASFVAATGALRNFAKFLAPTAFGAVALVVPLGAAFVTLGLLGAAGSFVTRSLGPLERELGAGAAARR